MVLGYYLYIFLSILIINANTQPIKISWPKQLENKKLDESISKDNLEPSYKNVISSNSSMHLKAKVSFQRILCYVWMLVLTLLLIKVCINASSKSPQYTIQPSPNNKTNLITPFSSDIVIYNSHADEAYPSGMTVTDVAALINDKLLNDGLKSSILKCIPPTEYTKSYETTRSLITNSVKNYSNTILLDIHRDVAETGEFQKRRILFVLCKNNPHYNENKQFVDGSSDRDIEDCINAFVSTIKNFQKSFTN